MRAPVDLNLAILQAVTPTAQRVGRKMQCRGVFANAHAAPVHRLDMHCPERPERPKRTIAHIRAHAKTLALTPVRPFLALLRTRFSEQLCLRFRMFARCFLAYQVVKPALERTPVEMVMAAIGCARQPALTPRLDITTQKDLHAVFSKCLKFTGDPPCYEGTPTCCDFALRQRGVRTGFRQAF